MLREPDGVSGFGPGLATCSATSTLTPVLPSPLEGGFSKQRNLLCEELSPGFAVHLLLSLLLRHHTWWQLGAAPGSLVTVSWQKPQTLQPLGNTFVP